MEDVEMSATGQPHPADMTFWNGKRVLLTGHTGFKGGWLSLWLQLLGAEVHGLSLAPPTDPSLFAEARVADGMVSTIGDIRTYETVASAYREADPEIVFHLAAQPLVRASYSDPLATYLTNVIGTAHVLEAARHSPGVRVVVNVTTDKVYENREWVWGYREDEPVGGFDPYSSSKGASELVTSAYRRSFMSAAGVAVASARAGNVIGGGDWAPDRLVPDILRAAAKGEPVVVRNPQSVRPWQHVLEPLSGYLLLAERLWYDGEAVAEAWNFGPLDSDAMPVSWIVGQLLDSLPGSCGWVLDPGAHPHEAGHLKLDISKARARLGWEPRWSLATALDRTAAWHRGWRAGEDVRQATLDQIREYSEDRR
jgi:CDP-glucose 4,6-dehydratase